MANHEAIYRGDAAMKKRAAQHLAVFGVGAIGSLLVDHLVRIGFPNISIFDMDRVDADNVFSQIYGKKQQGKLKVDALKEQIFLATGAKLNTEHRKVSSENIKSILKKLPPGTIVVDCFDNEESRRLLKDNADLCLHSGLGIDYGEAAWNEVYRVPRKPEGVDVCEYPQARSATALLIPIIAEVICRFVESGKKENYCFTLNDFKVSKY